MRTGLFGGLLLALVVGAAIAGPMLSPYDPIAMSPSQRLLPPGSAGHPLGTDLYGRDLLTRLALGGQLSLLIGAGPVALALPIGVVLGLAAGYFGRRTDMLISRSLDVVFAFPAILLAIAVVSVLGPGIANAILAIAITEVPTITRIVRAPVLSLREREFVVAARALGASNARILTHHILPNLVSPLTVFATVQLGNLILFGAALSFLGLGAQAPDAEWGLMLAEGRSVLSIAPWVATFPGIAILVAVLGFNFLGDGIRDIFDPRTKVRRTPLLRSQRKVRPT